ncbi:MAG: thioredoxin family protein [Candidatus Kaelpia aquatica]|nr:thioredoxin family protein [Candidatus Kaelpia aquatica]
MKIEILGMGCPKCKILYENTQAVVKEIGVMAEVVKVEDMDKITGYGVMMTPALVVDGEVKTSGKIPSSEEIKKWLKQ